MAEQNAVPNITEQGKQDLGGAPNTPADNSTKNLKTDITTGSKMKYLPYAGGALGAFLAYRGKQDMVGFMIFVGGGILAGVALQKILS